MTDPRIIVLPPLCKSGLVDLYAKQEAAKREYTLASNGALTALGLNPAEDACEINLDTGVITVAPKPEPPK